MSAHIAAERDAGRISWQTLVQAMEQIAGQVARP
jgi:hypothetical protein